MLAFWHNKKHRPVVEMLAGLLAQAAVFILVLLWGITQQTPDWVVSAFGALVLIGPQVVFVLRKGDLTDKLAGAATYVGLGIVLVVALFGMLILLGVVLSCLGLLKSW